MAAILPEFEVRTKRMLLRPLRGEDRDEFVRMHEASREFFEPWSPTITECETFDQLFEKQLRRTLDGLASGRDVRLAGFLDDGRLAGLFNLNEIVHGAFLSAYAGWKVNVEVARQGLGTEGVVALLDLAFAEAPRGLGLHRVQANIIPHNIPSIRLAERAGFVREGLARRYLRIAAIWQDHLMFAKLAEDHRGASM
jgi:ribosomal-protein-alanine N-acetyltransferase